jgi:hypothetical protein
MQPFLDTNYITSQQGKHHMNETFPPHRWPSSQNHVPLASDNWLFRSKHTQRAIILRIYILHYQRTSDNLGIASANHTRQRTILTGIPNFQTGIAWHQATGSLQYAQLHNPTPENSWFLVSHWLTKDTVH